MAILAIGKCAKAVFYTVQARILRTLKCAGSRCRTIFGFDPEDINVYFIGGVYSIPERIAEIRSWSEANGEIDLAIIDTSAAYFQGDDENANTQLGAHARDMRKLTELPGSPCVMVAAHPVKNATMDNLLPRGGGSFLNEIDGNLTLAKAAGGSRMHWQGKHRGVDFDPLNFELATVTAPSLVDRNGRNIPTVMARALTRKDTAGKAAAARKDEDEVLLQIDRDARQSLKAMAETLGWQKEGIPDKRRVSSATEKMQRSKLVTYVARKWKLSPSGQDLATEVKAERFGRTVGRGHLPNDR